tara:strand:+ start:14386 stop:15375 length:990 start_codon:yes stop_codon:yes gene_type:complete
MAGVYVVVEHDQGQLAPSAGEALTAARRLSDHLNEPVIAVVIGEATTEFVSLCEEHGIPKAVSVLDPQIVDYGPELWGQAMAELFSLTEARVVMATGTDRGNEILAQASARAQIPFVANCINAEFSGAWELTRMQWGGSLLEDVTLDTSSLFISYAHHSVEAEPLAAASATQIESIEMNLDPVLCRSLVQDRVTLSEGTTLSTAAVVVSGGRGVGSAEGFASLEALAGLLSGKVGCSRAVTNNGWRSHADQVGQTGTRIAPDIYIACGISGAIQHWVGAMASKNILAINTDPEANMVTKAGYAVIADLHEVVPAIIAEIERRRGNSTST